MVFLDGKFVPDAEAKVSVFDRSFLYGDGLFETLLVRCGNVFRWLEHFNRLQQGAEFLGINLPFSNENLRFQSAELIRRSALRDAVLRITLSRGVGRRGYSTTGADRPLLAMSLHPVSDVNLGQPSQWRLITSAFRLAAHDPLARFKTCNKLHQVVARAEAESQGADEALLLNTDGDLVEAASGNVFWIEKETVCTPLLTSSALPGVTRGVILEICAQLGMKVLEKPCKSATVKEADAFFLTLTSLGIVEAVSLDNQPLARSPLTARLHQTYHELVVRETSASDAIAPVP